MADGSAKTQYDNIKETGYYSNIIAGNISQQISTDSITVNIKLEPYFFNYYGTEKIIRPTSIVTRNRITKATSEMFPGQNIILTVS